MTPYPSPRPCVPRVGYTSLTLSVMSEISTTSHLHESHTHASDVAAAKDLRTRQTLYQICKPKIVATALKANRCYDTVVENFDVSVQSAQRELSSSSYHTYIDYTGFTYDVVLTRRDESIGNIHNIRLKVRPC